MPLLFGLAHCCQAQSVAPTKVEVDFDARAYAAGGGSSIQLYSILMRLETGLPFNTRLIAFGTYIENRYGLQQAAVEKDWGMQRLQAGIVRLPFGIYDPRETYASGLTDYPLVRAGYENHSLDWGVPGLQVIGGTPYFQVEAAGFSGHGVSAENEASTVAGGSLRAQTYTRDWILGASHWDGSLGASENKSVHLNGVDLRYTRPHLLLRGEYVLGEFAGDQMHGWYLDTYYRLVRSEKVTLVARWEQLKPGLDDPLRKQVTLGVRFVASPEWMLALNWRHTNGVGGYGVSSASGNGSGEFSLQAYRKIDR